MKIGVCIRAKNEQKIIVDWTKHYLLLGFDRIIIYDNMSEPSIETTLKKSNILLDNIIIIRKWIIWKCLLEWAILVMCCCSTGKNKSSTL